ncbi:hypothetical protein AB832_00645 [Flavobacteriaceae bacterium (ex Bugula neritina AB1)]|nr:hypothetical protein AB832_00645 [Flavobacteriaceae bacterium (ex Bugula neritina AB1)]
MGDKLVSIVCIILITIVFSCNSIDYQTIKIDNQNKEIEIINSEKFVIDSVSIEKLGKLYFSKSLKNKSKGSKLISLKNNDSDYRLYIDSLSTLKCDDDNLSLDIVIREKGSVIRITKEIAMNFKHFKEAQVLRGLKYEPCSKKISILGTDRQYK